MRLAVFTFVFLLAGCVQTAPQEGGALSESTTTSVLAAWSSGRTLQAPAQSFQPIVDITKCIATGDCLIPDAECNERNCETTRVTVPPGASRLAVQVRWPTDHSQWLGIHVLDASGKRVATGVSTVIDHLGAVAIVDKPEPGEFVVEVLALQGKGAYEASVILTNAARVEALVRELLPDLVTLPPTDLRFEDPPYQGVSYLMILPSDGSRVVTNALGAKGCALDEAANGARKCLRFSTGVGNAGDGPLDITLEASEAAGGRFNQVIRLTDGTTSTAPAGAAEFHAAHGHWHNAAANRNVVYTYDAATRERGEAVGEGKKVGICFADVGILDPAFERPDLPAHSGVPCLNPIVESRWSMGLSVGWYDLYDWVLSDQMVDLAGVPDGSYVLCSTANAEGSLREMDSDNNEACTAFELEGERVKLLDPPPYHATP